MSTLLLAAAPPPLFSGSKWYRPGCAAARSLSASLLNPWQNQPQNAAETAARPTNATPIIKRINWLSWSLSDDPSVELADPPVELADGFSIALIFWSMKKIPTALIPINEIKQRIVPHVIPWPSYITHT